MELSVVKTKFSFGHKWPKENNQSYYTVKPQLPGLMETGLNGPDN